MKSCGIAELLLMQKKEMAKVCIYCILVDYILVLLRMIFHVI